MITRKPFRRVGVAEARLLCQRPDLRILDVRDASAFSRDHIAGAENVSVANLFPIIEWTPKTAPILIYCYKGYASQEYAQIFADFGFQDVNSLDGGFEAWRREAHAPMVTGAAALQQTAPLKSRALG